MVKGVVNDSSHEITKIYHDGREIERVCDIYGNVLYLSSKTVTGAASLSFKNRKESTRNVVGFSVDTSSSDIESINAFMLSKLFIGKQISTSYFGVYLPEPGSYEITLMYTGQTYNFVSDGDVNTYFFIDLSYGAVSNRDIDNIYVEKQDGKFDFTKVKYAIFDTIYYDDRYDILNEHPVRFDNSIESYSIYGNNLNGVYVGDYDENSGNYMLPISIHGKNLFNVEDFFSSSINIVNGNMRFYEYTQEHVVGVFIQAENDDCYTMPYYQIPCEPGQYYTLSWYSDSNNPGLVYIFFYDSDGIEISQVHANNANSKQLTFLVPENAAITKLRLGVANAGSNIAYTNIQLERGRTKTNYISYQDPVMHTISLDEPLRKIGNELEYIQKRKSVTNGILHRVTQKTSNTAPLTFASTGQALKNYRIYGNTINGENVGDRTGNLFNGDLQKGYWINATDLAQTSSEAFRSFKIFLPAGTYTLSFEINVNIVRLIADGTLTQNIGNNLAEYTVTTQTDGDIGFSFRLTGTTQVPWDNSDIMLNSGTTPLPYEPYGYRVPVTIEGKNLLPTTNIYLPDQIKMVGDEAEYVDYQEQKLHRVRKNLWSGIVEQGSVSTLGEYANDSSRIRSKNISLSPGTYTISCNLGIRCIYAYNNSEKVSLVVDNGGRAVYRNTFTIPNGANNVSISLRAFNANGTEINNVTPSDFEWGQIEKGSEATTYEPYIENTELDAELPELQTVEGTNTLSIRTAVQPSQVLVEAMYPNDSYILTPEISTFEDINTITVNTEIPPESISITGKICPIS